MHLQGYSLTTKWIPTTILTLTDQALACDLMKLCRYISSIATRECEAPPGQNRDRKRKKETMLRWAGLGLHLGSRRTIQTRSCASDICSSVCSCSSLEDTASTCITDGQMAQNIQLRRHSGVFNWKYRKPCRTHQSSCMGFDWHKRIPTDPFT